MQKSPVYVGVRFMFKFFALLKEKLYPEMQVN